jgi:hypothetical protein
MPMVKLSDVWWDPSIYPREKWNTGTIELYCVKAWNGWATSKTPDQKFGIKAKLYRNFYPSMIDSLHVWAMLCESGMFEMCFLSATEDAIGKSDLILRSGGRDFRLALLGPTSQASEDREYKINHRGNGDAGCIEIRLPGAYPKSPGNKRWFRKSDVMKAILSHHKGGGELDMAAD